VPPGRCGARDRDADQNDRTRVIDASTAHRTASGWVYGFAELTRGQRRHRCRAAVSNPAATRRFLALVRPLRERGLVPEDLPVTVQAVSGYSAADAR